VATAPGEKKSHRAPPCEELDLLYDIKVVFVQKITFVFRKVNKNCCRKDLHFLTPVCTKSFVSWGFAPDPTGGAYSAFLDSLVVLRGPTSKERGEERKRKGDEEMGRERKRGEARG